MSGTRVARTILLAGAPLLLVLPWTALLAGCGAGKTIELRYDRPATYEISPSVRKLAIAEFGGTTEADRRWGDLASDLLGSQLDAYNKQYSRYELVDRKRLKGILDERDLQLAISDTASATKAGKIAKVDAMIYGNVKVIARDEQATRMVIDPLSQSMRPMTYTKRYCMAAVNFTMDDINSSKTLATVTATRDYDSEKKDKGGVGKVFGMSGGAAASDDILRQLIGECVDEIVAKISPHQVVVNVALQKGKSKAVDAGNKMAYAGDYNGALEMYLQGVSARPDDVGAIFNAGAMYEAQRNFPKALELYDRAIRMSPEQEFIDARQRVRGEGTSKSGPTGAEKAAPAEEKSS